jgi:CRP/FNR family cyclic AMP-dependent transcriptional regulator
MRADLYSEAELKSLQSKLQIEKRRKCSQMQRPYGIELSESYRNCKFRGDGFLCKSSADELKSFEAIKQVSAYPAEAILFMEQERSRGIYLLCEGRVKLSFTSSQGKTLVLRIAKPGEVLGLLSTLTGNPYELTAETLQPCQVAFVSSDDFKKFLQKHPGVFHAVAGQLGGQYKAACQQLRMIGLGASVIERLGEFLLNWPANVATQGNASWFTLPLKHEEISQHIGSTRESVTRALSEFRNRGLVETDGSTFVIVDRTALEEFCRRSSNSQEAKRYVLHVTPIRRGREHGIRHRLWKRVASGGKTA